MTVRPERPEPRSRSETSSARRFISSCSWERSETSRAKVSSAETETGSAASSRSRGSIPRARARSRDPSDPGRSAFRSGSGNVARPPIVCTPAACRRFRARSDPGRRRTASGARKSASVPAGTTVTPPGFRRSDAILHTTFEVPTPSEQVRLVVARTAVWIADATARALTKSSTTVPRSRYPSSIPVRSMRGTISATVSQTTLEYCRYSAWRGERRRRKGSAEAPRPSSSPSGSRTCARRSSRSTRPLARADRHRRRAASRAGPDPRAPRPRRRRRRDRDARRSARRKASGDGIPGADPDPGGDGVETHVASVVWVAALSLPCERRAPLPPPAIEQPAPHQVSYGLVTGRAARGTTRVIVFVDGRKLASKPLRGRRFSPRLASHGRRHRSSDDDRQWRPSLVERRWRRVRAPRRVATPCRSRATGLRAGEEARTLDREFKGTTGFYVQSLTGGAGAAWNAKARFPAASTLKLAIAATVLAEHSGIPPPGSHLDALLREMLIPSDDAAANSLLVWLGGSTSSGAYHVNDLMRSIGLTDTLMYGGTSPARCPTRSPSGSTSDPRSASASTRPHGT